MSLSCIECRNQVTVSGSVDLSSKDYVLYSPLGAADARFGANDIKGMLYVHTFVRIHAFPI
jgi:hypothetical protein